MCLMPASLDHPDLVGRVTSAVLEWVMTNTYLIVHAEW